MVDKIMSTKANATGLKLVVSNRKSANISSLNEAGDEADSLKLSTEERIEELVGKIGIPSLDWFLLLKGFLSGIWLVVLAPFRLLSMLMRTIGNLGMWILELQFKILYGGFALLVILLFGKIVFEVITH